LNLAKLREAKGLTQTEVGEAIGVGQTAVSMWETGTNTPRSIHLIKLSKLFDCTIEELLEDRATDGKEVS